MASTFRSSSSTIICCPMPRLMSVISMRMPSSTSRSWTIRSRRGEQDRCRRRDDRCPDRALFPEGEIGRRDQGRRVDRHPNDPSNGGRALRLLQAEKLIELKDGVGILPTTLDITGNPRKLKIREIDAAQLPRSLDDVDAAVINTNYAVPAGLIPGKDSIAIESSSTIPTTISSPFARRTRKLLGSRSWCAPIRTIRSASSSRTNCRDRSRHSEQVQSGDER